MPIHIPQNAEEFEAKGRADLELVGIRYTGPRSTVIDRDVRERAAYNGPPAFQRGQVYLAVLPTNLDETVEDNSRGAHAIEARSDFDVIYDAKTLAGALLNRNYLPPSVFYEGFDRYQRQKVFEKLGLEDAGRVHDRDDEEIYREQLREIAGVDGNDGKTAAEGRAEAYRDRWSRDELKALVKLLREDAGDINLNRAGMTELSEFLSAHDADVVETAVDVAFGDADETVLDDYQAGGTADA